MDEGHKTWYSGEDSKHQYGVAFASAALPSPPDSSPAGSQRGHTKSVIQVYATTSDHEDKEVEQFYE